MNKKKPGIGQKISLFISIALIITMVIIGFFCYKVFREKNIALKAEYALSYTKTVADIIDPNELIDLMSGGVKNDYWYSVKHLIDKAYNAAGLTYLYVILPYDEDNYIYFAEGEPYDGSYQALDFMEIDSKEEYLEETDEVFFTGNDITTDIYDSGIYGMVISGFSVIHGADGQPIALVGADIKADDIIRDSNAFLAEISIIVLILSNY